MRAGTTTRSRVAAPALLAEDLEAAAEGRVVPVGDDRLEGRHGRVDHDLVADRPPVDAVAHLLDDAGHVAARHVGQRRAWLAAGEPQVHVVQGAGDRPHRDVAGADRRVVDRAEAVRTGRLVEDPGLHGHIVAQRSAAPPPRPGARRGGARSAAADDSARIASVAAPPTGGTRRRSRVGPMDDAALVEAARSGDGSAWGAIYDRYADKLHDHCHRILRDRDEAADALHDAFIAASRHLDQLRDPTRLRPWLYSICRHESLRRARQRSRVDLTDEVDEMSGAEVDLDRGTRTAELQELVWSAAAGLSPRDQALLDLNLRQGLDGPGPGRCDGDLAEQLLRDAQPPARSGGALARRAADRPSRARGLRASSTPSCRVGTASSPRCSASEWLGTSTAATCAENAAPRSPARWHCSPQHRSCRRRRSCERASLDDLGSDAAVPPVRFTRDGFAAPEHDRLGGRPVWWLAAAAVALLAIVGGLLAMGGGDDRRPVAAVVATTTTTEASSSTTDAPTTTTVPATTTTTGALSTPTTQPADATTTTDPVVIPPPPPQPGTRRRRRSPA